MPRGRFGLILATFLLLGSVPVLADEAAEQQLQQLTEEVWQFNLREDPLLATSTGDHRYNDRLPAVAPADYQRRLAAKREFRQRASAIDRAQLGPAERINFDIFCRLLDHQIAEHEFQTWLFPISTIDGFHLEFLELPNRLPLATVRDYENYIARLNGFGKYADEHIELMQMGIEQKLVQSAVTLVGYDEAIRPQLVDDPTKHLLYKPFLAFPASIAASDRERLAKAGAEAIAGVVVPGYRRFLKFMQEEYEPVASGLIGASSRPRGKAFYRHRVRWYTTLDITPEQVHQIGLDEVKRIREEMDEVVRKSGFKGDRAAFVTFLRTDPQFYVQTPEAMLKEVSRVLKRIDGELPKLFNNLPRTPYGLRPVPDYVAPRTTTAYYAPPPGDRSDAGYYYVNTSKLESRPLYEIEALSLHEAVPGHHLQIALQQELTDLPNFRRFAGFTAFVEGWALYAERLGLEVGFYTDPYSDFGRLTYEMWRACRLVVDTGMHYFGWTRQQAIDFMVENTALSVHNVTAEVDRYIAWPGQALGYKIGELKIRALRKHAEERLGGRFDIRRFHDVVLENGAIPLDVLEANVEQYIVETLNSNSEKASQ